jgi:hypothetical protein
VKVVHLNAGDTLEVKTYERLLPLVPHDMALGSLRAVRRGDCVVAFSRKEVHGIKRAIDSYGHLKCCMVYGALPAEARTQQVPLPSTCCPCCMLCTLQHSLLVFGTCSVSHHWLFTCCLIGPAGNTFQPAAKWIQCSGCQ